MGKYKYRIKENPDFEVGDVDYGDGTRSTVSNIDPNTGSVTWDIEYIPNLEKLFDAAKELVDTSKGVRAKVKDDSKFEEILSKAKSLFNNIRTHLRKNYPEDYKRIKIKLDELSTSGGAGAYLTKYAFKLPKNYKKIDEGIGASLGPGPKAGPEGVKDNYYIKKFKYKLVPKDKQGTYVQKGSGLEVKKLF